MTGDRGGVSLAVIGMIIGSRIEDQRQRRFVTGSQELLPRARQLVAERDRSAARQAADPSRSPITGAKASRSAKAAHRARSPGYELGCRYSWARGASYGAPSVLTRAFPDHSDHLPSGKSGAPQREPGSGPSGQWSRSSAALAAAYAAASRKARKISAIGQGSSALPAGCAPGSFRPRPPGSQRFN